MKHEEQPNPNGKLTPSILINRAYLNEAGVKSLDDGESWRVATLVIGQPDQPAPNPWRSTLDRFPLIRKPVEFLTHGLDPAQRFGFFTNSLEFYDKAVNQFFDADRVGSWRYEEQTPVPAQPAKIEPAKEPSLTQFESRMYQLCSLLGAKSDLLSTIGSYRDCATEAEVIEWLDEWIADAGQTEKAWDQQTGHAQDKQAQLKLGAMLQERLRTGAGYIDHSRNPGPAQPWTRSGDNVVATPLVLEGKPAGPRTPERRWIPGNVAPADQQRVIFKTPERVTRSGKFSSLRQLYFEDCGETWAVGDVTMWRPVDE